MAEAPEFKTRGDLEAWLSDKPREVAVAIAARAALRVLPLAAFEFQGTHDSEAVARFLILASAIFRATAVARAAASFPTRPIDSAAASASALAVLGVALAAAPRAATRAAARAANAAAIPTFARSFAADASAFAADAAAFIGDDAWAATKADASFATAVEASVSTLLDETSVEAICRRAKHLTLSTSLWFDVPPKRLINYWRQLRSALPPEDDWQVWIDWYDRRLKGVADPETIELIYASVPESEWDKGPAAANKWIRGRLEEMGWYGVEKQSSHEVDEAAIARLLTQDSHGATVEVVGGQARFAPSGNAEDAAVAQDQQTIQQHERARVRAVAARDRVLRLANQPGFESIAVTVDELSRQLASDTRTVADNISTVWELSTAIGTFIERDDEVRAGRGGMTPQMDADARESLDQFVVALAPFVRRFPTARQNDEDVRLFRQTRESVEAPKRILEQAAAENLIESQSNRIIIVAASAAERGEGIQAEKSRSWLGKTARNFIIALVVATGTTAGALTMKFSEKAVEEFYEHSQSREIIQKFLREKEKYVIELFKDLPPDLKGALREVYRRLREGSATPPSVDPTIRV